MKRYLFLGKKPLFLCILLSIAASVLSTLISLIFAVILDVAENGSIKKLLTVTVFALCSILLFNLLQYFSGRAKINYMARVIMQLKNDLFTALITRDIHVFEQKNSTAYLNELTTNVNLVGERYFNNFFTTIDVVVGFATATAVTLTLQPWLFIIMIALGVIIYFFSRVTGKDLGQLTSDYSCLTEKYQVSLREYFSAYRLIAAFSLTGHIIAKHHASNQGMESKKAEFEVRSVAIQNINTFVGFLASVLITVIAAVFAMEGKASIGIVFAVGHLMGRVTSPLSRLPAIITGFKSSAPIRNNLEKIIFSEGKDAAVSKEHTPYLLAHEIGLEDVSFSYGGKPVIDGLNVRFQKGKKYAVIGSSGAGKSTLLSLVSGLLKATEGEILIDGTSVAAIDPKAYVSAVVYIAQDTFLFDDTVKNNLTMFDHSIPPEEIDEAIRTAELTAFLNGFEAGLDGVIKESGKNISGGEKQRIAIARALLKKPQVLLLDEISSAIDILTAEKIEERVLAMSGLTVISVTHRTNPALLRLYDEILVMGNGKIVEQGAYTDLIGRNGYLSAMHKLNDISLGIG